MRRYLPKDNFENYMSPFELKQISLYERGKTYAIGHGKFAGKWFYDSMDTTSADNVGVIVVNGSNQRLKRVLDVYLDNRWFGSTNFYFDSVTDVNVKFPASIRRVGLTAQILVSGVLTEYWYIGTEDGNLVAKQLIRPPEDKDIKVGEGINVGDASITFPESIGWRGRMFRRYSKQGKDTSDDTYFSHEPTTGTFNWSPAATSADSFQFEFY